MNWKLTAAARRRCASAAAGTAQAEGELNIYNWGNYTSPELIEKFEETYKSRSRSPTTTPTTRRWPRSAPAATASTWSCRRPTTCRSGSAKGLLPETGRTRWRISRTSIPDWVNVDWDPGRKYTVPWQWGTTGVVVNTAVYKGDINTSAIFLDPPPELEGKINVVPEMNDVMYAAITLYRRQAVHRRQGSAEEGARQAGGGQAEMVSMDYATIEKMAPTAISRPACDWNGCGHARAPAEPGCELWLSEGRLRHLDGQCRRPDGRAERRERQAVPELHHGAGKRRADLGLRHVCQRHQGVGSLHAEQT